MPYYQAGDYYQGDYYQAGGIFGSIGKLVKKVAGTALRAIPGVGAVVSGIDLAKSLIPTRPTTMRPSPFGAPGTLFEGAVPSFGGGPFPPGGFGGMGFGKRRRMNVTNVKALRRAGRRVRGFLKIARRLGALPVATSGKGRLFKKRARR